MKRVVPVAIVLVLTSVSFLSCGYSSSAYKPPSGLFQRVVISQQVSSGFVFGSLIILDAENDTLPTRSAQISAGTSPGFMALSSNRATLLVFDSSNNSVQVIDATTEQNSGSVTLPGPTTSLAIPGTTSIGYAAVPTVAINGYPSGAVEVMNVGTSPSLAKTISVPKAQTVIANPAGSQLLVFSNDSNSVAVVSPALANGPVDTSCDTAPNSVCTMVSGFDAPVFAVYGSGNIAYILNSGAENHGNQASVAVLDLSTLTITQTIPVNGATMAFLSGTTLYVVGSPPGFTCIPPNYPNPIGCGTLDIVDLNTLTDTNFANPVVITDGTHTRMDMSLNGQLFLGSLNCTNLGDTNNPQNGPVRGCLAIYNTSNGNVIFPPQNGDVTGLQSFTTRDVEYVMQGTILRIYDTTQDALQVDQFNLSGQFIDVKAIDFF